MARINETNYIPVDTVPAIDTVRWVDDIELYHHHHHQSPSTYNDAYEAIVVDDDAAKSVEFAQIENSPDEYALVHLGNDTYQVFKTSDLNQLIICTDPEPSSEPTAASYAQDTNVSPLKMEATGIEHVASLGDAEGLSYPAGPNQSHGLLFHAPSLSQELGLDRDSTFNDDDGRESYQIIGAHQYFQQPQQKADETSGLRLSSTKKRKRPKKKEKSKTTETVIYACEICDITFSNEFSLTAHVKQHQVWNEKPESGSNDSAKSEATHDETKPNLIVVEGRYDAIAGRGLFQCGICGKTFRNVGYIHMHLEQGHDVTREGRIIADRTKDKNDSQDRNKIGEDDEARARVDGGEEREATTTAAARLDENKSDEDVTIPYRCDKCHRTYPVLDQFLEHKVTHYRTFDCFVCQKSYTAKKSLQNHMQTHVTGHARIDLCSTDNGEETKLNAAGDDYELS